MVEARPPQRENRHLPDFCSCQWYDEAGGLQGIHSTRGAQGLLRKPASHAAGNHSNSFSAALAGWNWQLGPAMSRRGLKPGSLTENERPSLLRGCWGSFGDSETSRGYPPPFSESAQARTLEAPLRGGAPEAAWRPRPLTRPWGGNRWPQRNLRAPPWISPMEPAPESSAFTISPILFLEFFLTSIARSPSLLPCYHKCQRAQPPLPLPEH